MVELNHRLLLTSYPINRNDDTDDSSPSEEATTFDSDMVVMLAALLCALVAALLLNSVIHIILRRRRESMEASTNVQPAVGLEKRALRKIPVAVFRLRTSGSSECSICLGDFVDGERVRVLPECKHEFHVKCVDKWLKEHASCPNCRRSLVPPKVVDAGDRATARAERGGAMV
ncbi:putative transcription factor C2H2 family [Helianthus annuus]|nr:putative transcription factor C2H2 family [Helianthus annuus]